MTNRSPRFLQKRHEQNKNHLIPEKECEQEDPDVRTVNVRIGHDHDAVVPQAARVELVTLSASSKTREEKRSRVGQVQFYGFMVCASGDRCICS